MSSQSDLFDAQAFNSGPNAVPPPNSQAEAIATAAAPLSRGRLWTERIFLVIYVAFCIEIGLLLTVVPWAKVWTENSIMAAYPALRAIAQGNFVRGLVTGLGIVDIWLGVWEAVHYRELKPAPRQAISN